MLALDHIVIAAQHKEDAYMNGIHTVTGGVHEQWGTANELAHFHNDSYIEWLFILQDKQAKSSSNPLIKHLLHMRTVRKEKGPFQIAFRTDRLDDYLDHFTANDIPFIGPLDASRKTADGTILTWKMLFPLYDIETETLPFLIQWDQDSSIRIKQTDINDASIHTVHFGALSAERFEAIYQLTGRENQPDLIQLANCQLQVSKNGIISFTTS